MDDIDLIKQSLSVEWKTSLCQSGESCWCRIIDTKTKIKDDDSLPL